MGSDRTPARPATVVQRFVNTVLLAGLLYFTAALSYALFESARPGGGVSPVIIAVCLVGVLTFATAMLLKPEFKARLALLALSSGMAIYLFEAGLAVLLSGPRTMEQARVSRLKAAERLGLRFDERSKYEVVAALRDRGVRAYPHVPPAIFLGRDGISLASGERILPLAGVSRVRTVHCNESGDYAIYDSDEHGFNNPEGSHQAGRVQIALLGDSFAEGACVDPGESPASQLRARGRATVSLGQGGSGPLFALAALSEYAAPLQPRFVFWLYYEGNDLSDLRKESRAAILAKYFDGAFSRQLVDRQDEIDRALREYVDRRIDRAGRRGQIEEARRPLPIWRLARLYHLRSFLRALVSRPPPELETVLSEARHRVQSWGGELIFVYLPEYRRYANVVHHGLFHSRARVLSTARDLEIPIVDFHEDLSAHPDPQSLFPLRTQGHYTAAGYRLLAQRIDETLRHRNDEPSIPDPSQGD